MTQLSFHFKTHKLIKKITEEKAYEHKYKNLDFILYPYAFLLGLKHHDRSIDPSDQMLLLCELFCRKENGNDFLKVQQSVEAFMAEESSFFKKDPKKPLRNGNAFDAALLQKIVAIGTIELKREYKGIKELKAFYRRKLPTSNPPLLFSKIARYINNGRYDERWYEITGKEIAELFSDFEPELIASLLGVTSIRASLPSNVTKFYKVLNQFFENKIYKVLVGSKGKKKEMVSTFNGVLDASLLHLNALKNNGSLLRSGDRKKNGRKIKNFIDAMLTNIMAIVADVWITRAFGCDRLRVFRSRTTSQSPTRAIYDAIEWYLQTLATSVNKEPRGLCAMIWSGIRQESVRGETRYSEALKRRLDHGLFAEQYGKLVPGPKGIGFQEFF